MIKYSGYLINTEPDYKEMISKGEGVTDLWCSVYDEQESTKFYRVLSILYFYHKRY